jgi:GxxExxY protein
MQTSSEKHSQWLASMRPPVPEAWGRLVEEVVLAAEEVHGLLGPGLGAAGYEAALAHELSLRGVAVTGREAVPVVYKGVALPAAELELHVHGLMVVLVRAGVEAAEVGGAVLARLDERTRALDAALGLVIDFGAGVLRNGVYRRLNRVSSAALALVGAIEVGGEN